MRLWIIGATVGSMAVVAACSSESSQKKDAAGAKASGSKTSTATSTTSDDPSDTSAGVATATVTVTVTGVTTSSATTTQTASGTGTTSATGTKTSTAATDDYGDAALCKALKSITTNASNKLDNDVYDDTIERWCDNDELEELRGDDDFYTGGTTTKVRKNVTTSGGTVRAKIEMALGSSSDWKDVRDAGLLQLIKPAVFKAHFQVHPNIQLTLTSSASVPSDDAPYASYTFDYMIDNNEGGALQYGGKTSIWLLPDVKTAVFFTGLVSAVETITDYAMVVVVHGTADGGTEVFKFSDGTYAVSSAPNATSLKTKIEEFWDADQKRAHANLEKADEAPDLLD